LELALARAGSNLVFYEDDEVEAWYFDQEIDIVPLAVHDRVIQICDGELQRSDWSRVRRDIVENPSQNSFEN
jgi:hypothetical protein